MPPPQHATLAMPAPVESPIQGMALRQITKRLNDQGTPTPMGRDFWRPI